MEGIMMRSPKRSVLAVRQPDGTIATEDMHAQSVRQKFKILNLPIIRGVVAFVESFFIGYKAIMRSASLAGLEEETKGNKVLEGLLMVLAVVLGFGLAAGLFMVAPAYTVKGLSLLFEMPNFVKTLIEGIVRIAIFILYLFLVSRMKDIKRMFEYHGAEHKTIFCFEAGEELTVENVKKQSRLHPRCGTNFLFLVMIISIFVSSFISWDVVWQRVLIKFLTLPLVAGLSFELIRFSGMYDNVLTRIISAPGRALQLLTTNEPHADQIEVAITALEASLKENDGSIDQKAAYEGE